MLNHSLSISTFLRDLLALLDEFDGEARVEGTTVLEIEVAQLIADSVVNDEDVDGVFASWQVVLHIRRLILFKALSGLLLRKEPVVGAVNHLGLEKLLGLVKEIFAYFVRVDMLVGGLLGLLPQLDLTVHVGEVLRHGLTALDRAVDKGRVRLSSRRRH